METAMDYLGQVIGVLKRAKDDYAECSKQLSLLDQEAQDVIHCIENDESFSAYRGYQLAKNLREIRHNRRFVKNRQQLLQALLGNLKTAHLAALEKKLLDKAHQQTEFTYTPRVLTKDA